MDDSKQVLVFARHPSGGIRTYFRYVYGDPVMENLLLTLLAPRSDALTSVVEELAHVQDKTVTEDKTRVLFFSLLNLLFKGRFDLIHSHGFTAGLLAALPARILRIPHIVTTHDVFLEGQFPGLKGRVKKWLIGRVLNMATVINPVGEDAKSNLIETYPYLGRKGKVLAVRNGIDARPFLTDEVRPVREEAGVSSEALLVGFFGRFMAQKGFGTLVAAVEQWNRQPGRRPLHVACFGWGGFIREEQAELAKKGLEQYFHFFPATNDMAPALRGVDAVVMPSRWEACPLLPMEAMVAGVPVIGTRCIGLKEVAEDSPVLLFDIDSVEVLLSRLEELEMDPDGLRQAAEQFRSQASERFEVRQTAVDLHAIFDSL